jgi:hypothetical protein
MFPFLIETGGFDTMNELFKYLNQGASRIVYEISDNLVLKIAKDQDNDASWGRQQCQIELETYLKYGTKLPLCKIFVDSSSETRILMERVKPYNMMVDITTEFEMNLDLLIMNLEYNPEDIPKFLEQNPNPKFVNFVKKFEESGLTQNEIRDILYDVGVANLGEDADGEIIILDYGMVYA